MVNKLTLYIGKTVLVNIFLALFFLIGLEVIFSLVNEIRHVGSADYTLGIALQFIIYSIPSHIAQLFPMATLLGTLLGLGQLSGRSELIVMRAAGLSINDIILKVFTATSGLIFLIWIMGETLAPITDKIAHQKKTQALSSGQAIKTAHGTWMRDGDNFIHVQVLHPNGKVEGITRYEFDQNLVLKKSSFAKMGIYETDHWILKNIKETIFDADQVAQRMIPSEQWETHIDPKLLSIVTTKEIDDLSIPGLWKTIQYRKKNELDPANYQLAFWQKWFRPIACLVMIFLAIPFIFGPLRSTGMGVKMVLGIVVGFAFYTINQLFGPLTLVYHLPPFWGAALPTLLFLAGGVLVMRRPL